MVEGAKTKGDDYAEETGIYPEDVVQEWQLEWKQVRRSSLIGS